jgi:hypothetical protein
MGTTPISRASCSSSAAGAALALLLLAAGRADAAHLTDAAFDDGMKLQITAAGAVRKPGNPFFIAGNTNQAWETCAGAAWYELSFNKADIGTAWFNTSTSRFTAPVTGLYFFTASLYSYSSGGTAGYQHFDVGVNGNQVGGGGRYGGSYQILGFGSGEGTYNTSHYVARILRLNAGDYVSVWNYCSSGGQNLRYGAHYYFAGILLQ